MTEEELEKIVRKVQVSIEASVKEQISAFTKKFDEYVVKDEAWKKTAQPVVNAYETTVVVSKFMRIFGSLLQELSKVILAIGVIIGTYLGFIKLTT